VITALMLCANNGYVGCFDIMAGMDMFDKVRLSRTAVAKYCPPLFVVMECPCACVPGKDIAFGQREFICQVGHASGMRTRGAAIQWRLFFA
jgi:hypothetical protein